MRKTGFGLCVVALLWVPCAFGAEKLQASDLRRAVPADAYMAVYGKHNPERDYQRQHWKEVWDTVQETQIIEKAVKIVTDRMPEQDLQKAQSVLDELLEAAAPIDLEALMDCSEVVYAQTMQPPSGERPFPSAQHLVLMRLTPEAASGCEEGIKNLFGMVEKYSGGQVPVRTVREGDATITGLAIPAQVPFHPMVVRIDDVFMFSTSEELARRSLKMLTGGEGPSKFDDPRLKEALTRLPEPEDSLVFYDGKQQFSQMREMGGIIRKVSDQPEAARVADLIELLFDEVSILDCEVTVEYTEGNQNRSEAYGKLVPGAEEKMLAKVFGSGEAFENWQGWVPAEARSYHLTTGANLHLAYEWIMELVKERFPEAGPILEQFEGIQAQYDVHLDRDILQAFSGEFVSVSLPAASESMPGGQDSVTALRCHKPERIRELLHRLVDFLQQFPPVKAQQLQLTESDALEGFDELSLLVLNALQVRPVIGFHDGWMFVGSNSQAVQKVLDTRAGQGETIADTEAFTRFGLEIGGPVASIQYTDLAASTRDFAKFLNQAGMVAPMIIGLVGAQADPEELKPVQEVLALLPSVARIVEKFDFYEANISVVQDGDEPLSYTKRTATLVRPASGD